MKLRFAVIACLFAFFLFRAAHGPTTKACHSAAAACLRTGYS